MVGLKKHSCGDTVTAIPNPMWSPQFPGKERPLQAMIGCPAVRASTDGWVLEEMKKSSVPKVHLLD
jgi:hypothetical protein